MTSRRQTRADAVRNAVDEAFTAAAGQAQVGRDRASELVDELAQAAGRVREALDDLRPPTAEDARALRADLRSLERRVVALEKGTPTRAAKRRPAAKAKAKTAKKS
jgi:polyhydroxyalkanoate synthesis regulator phasin